MTKHRGRHEQTSRRVNNPTQGERTGGFEQTGTGYRYDDQNRRFSSREGWREPSGRSGYPEGRDYESRDYAGSRGWEQDWGRSREYGDEYEPRYSRGGEDYGYQEQRFRGMDAEGYEPGDYSYSGRQNRAFGRDEDWSSRMRGSYGASSSHEPWSEGSYQGSRRSVTQGSFGQGSQRRSQFQSSQGLFAGRGPQNYKRSDDRISEDINEALTQDPDIDAYNIQVEVQNGEITLKGSVSDRDPKRRAEDIAESVAGAREVQNQLRIKRDEESDSESSKRERDDKRHRQQMAS